MALPSSPFDVALIGAGRVGTAVAALLKQQGHRIVGVASRSAESAELSAARLDAVVFDPSAPVAAEVYLLGAGASALGELAGSLATSIDLSDRVVLHFAGVAGIRPLESAVAAGGHACALHPVQACPDVDAAMRNLPGSSWGMTTSVGARAWAERFVEGLGGTPVHVAESDRPMWHAASVVTSNGIAALLAGGELLLREIGVDGPADVLGPLAAGTVANARHGGGGAVTLTGPIVRGETDTVAAHVEALRDHDELIDLYRSVSAYILLTALRAGRIDRPTFSRMSKVLQ